MFADQEKLKQAFIEKLHTMHGECIDEASAIDKYMALGNVVREFINKKWVQTNAQYFANGQKQVYYFSLEFLLGKLMGSNLINLQIKNVFEDALKELEIDLRELENQESDAGLGNGGLGRLAACFLDSLASLSLPGHGCGIRY
ncbi:MAG: glycogen/starch/alpha-glucan phosphorylase, partial [Clostridia bacterium]|nr:glycogen/starch/alpha-glucan phosphorylase [Clostridia bacterium]